VDLGSVRAGDRFLLRQTLLKEMSEPATKEDLDHAITRMERFVLDREAALIWKVMALQVTLIGAIAAAQWAAISFTLTHWKP
jgi:hypothetical protein